MNRATASVVRPMSPLKEKGENAFVGVIPRGLFLHDVCRGCWPMILLLSVKGSSLACESVEKCALVDLAHCVQR